MKRFRPNLSTEAVSPTPAVAFQPEPGYAYRAFGLEICSDLALRELAGGTGRTPDLVIRKDPARPPEPVSGNGVFFHFREDTQGGPEVDTMAWDAVGRFNILGRDNVAYAPADCSGDALISLPLLGPVMAVLLHRRGLLTLHGSAVRIDGQACVFLGDKGAGKSTTAAALVRAGHPLLTDDIVAVDFQNGQAPHLWPGYPQVKLTDTATEALPLAGSETMPSPHPEFGKHRHLLSGTFDPDAVAVAEAVVLTRGDMFAVEPLTGLDAVQALMRFSYVTRFGDRIIRGAAQAVHLRQCAAVANSAAVYRLIVPHDLARLEEVVETVREMRAARSWARGTKS